VCVKICGGGRGRVVLEAAADDEPVVVPVVDNATRRFGRGRMGRDVFMSAGPSCDEADEEE